MLLPPAKLSVRCACMLYEALLLFAVCFICAYLYLTLTQQKYPLSPLQRHFFQGYIFFIIGCYFIYFWRKSGQTLAMKTWRIGLIQVNGERINLTQAIARYIFAWLSVMLFMLGFLWALIDKDKQFLHDRLLGTRLVRHNHPKPL